MIKKNQRRKMSNHRALWSYNTANHFKIAPSKAYFIDARGTTARKQGTHWS